MEHKFKVGDRVERLVCHPSAIKECPAGYQFVVAKLGFDGVFDSSGLFHALGKLKPAPLNTAEKLAEAEAQVAALKAQLAAENAPKVGRTYRMNLATEAVVQEVFDGLVWYRYRQHRSNGEWGVWRQTMRSVQSFQADYALVEDTDDSRS